MNHFDLYYKDKFLKGFREENDAYIYKQGLIKTEGYIESESIGSSNFVIKTVPDDIAKTLFTRAKKLSLYNKGFNFEHFLSEVYGICGDYIREDKKVQELIQGIIERNYN